MQSTVQPAKTIVEDESDKPPPPSVQPETAFADLHSGPAPAPSVKDGRVALPHDWHWQLRNRIRRVAQLKKGFPDIDYSGLADVSARFPMAITPYYASLIKKCDNTDPIFLQCMPQIEEMIELPCLKDDPLEEDEDMPVPGLVHRYGDRALLISTTMCAMYCRHCTRKRVAGHRETYIREDRLNRAVKYLAAHPEIHDVIVSGGDPLTMPTSLIEKVLTAIRSVPSVDIVRIGTRTPVVLPMRITDELVRVLRRFHPLFINTHFNHPVEVTPAAAEACARLADAGIPLGNQTVLLRGINDDPHTIEALCRALLRIRVRPYYLFQCDLVRGVEHFRTPISRGIEIMEYLRGRMSGLGIPAFVVDAPHGGGKIPVAPNYVVSVSPTHTVLRNFEGLLVAYPEPPSDIVHRGGAPRDESAPGVWELASGAYTRIEPRSSMRSDRRARAAASAAGSCT